MAMFDKHQLELNLEQEVQSVSNFLVNTLSQFRRKGLVVGVSGGIDSSTCLALAVKAVGRERVQAILMPERDSSPRSIELGRMACESQQVPYVVEDISPILEGAGCYRRRDEAIRQVFPEYNETYKQKIVVPPLTERDRLTYFSIVIQSPTGEIKRERLPLQAYLQIVASTNFKQRTRAMMEYYHADRLNYAVIGTPNRLEYDQGFFVKGGDGLADIKPIAHLYKTQVYAMARYLGLPPEVTNTTPTTDTYSMAQGQDEFYFALPYQQMDLLLYAFNHHISAADAAQACSLTEEQVNWVYRDIQTKRRTTRYLHLAPVVIDNIEGVGAKYKERSEDGSPS